MNNEEIKKYIQDLEKLEKSMLDDSDTRGRCVCRDDLGEGGCGTGLQGKEGEQSERDSQESKMV